MSATTSRNAQMPEAVTAFFASESWTINHLEDAPVAAVRGGYRGESGEWYVDVLWHDDVEQLVIHSTAPKPVAEDRCAAVAGYLTFVNYGLPVGNFELSPITGNVRVKTGLAIASHELTEDIVARQVYANVMTMDRYLPGIVQVVWGTEPADAYAAIDG
jgi:hypothetical protein